MPTFEARALIYQRILLSDDPEIILDLSYKLKELFLKENIGNAFNEELKKILIQIKIEDVPSNYSTFYISNFKSV